MRQLLILGLGHVGKALGARFRADGVKVVGTTTTPGKAEALREFADEVHVLRGSDAAGIKAVGEKCDAIVATVAPNVRQARTREEREATYRDALVASCQSAAAANKRVIFLSSFSVYGDGGPGTSPITEETGTRNETEPSARYYAEAERAVLGAGAGCVLRLPDIYGAPGDLSFAQRVMLAHQIMKGKVPFGPDAPLYIINFQDVVSAAEHVIRKNLTGIYNVCVDGKLPKTNKQVFDELARRQHLEPLEFLAQIQAPNRQISAAKLYATGWKPQHTDPDYPLRA